MNSFNLIKKFSSMIYTMYKRKETLHFITVNCVYKIKLVKKIEIYNRLSYNKNLNLHDYVNTLGELRSIEIKFFLVIDSLKISATLFAFLHIYGNGAVSARFIFLSIILM